MPLFHALCGRRSGRRGAWTVAATVAGAVAGTVAAAVAVVTAAALAGPVRADEAEDVAAAVLDLTSENAADREAARAAILGRGPEVALHLLRPMLRDRGGAGTDAILDVMEKLGTEEVLAILAHNRSAWPGNFVGVEEFLGRLRDRRRPQLTRRIRLEPRVLEDPRRLPPSLLVPVDGRIPASLVAAERAVTAEDDHLSVDTDGDGQTDTRVGADRPEAVAIDVDGRKVPVAVLRMLGTWSAGSASILTGKADGETIEILDGDLDGRFDGPGDLIALGGDAFRPHSSGPLLDSRKGVLRYRVQTGDDGVTLALTPEPVLRGLDPALVRAIDAANAWRAGAGLPPVTVDLPRSADCQAHVEYWRLNGFSAHDESATLPGFSKAGLRAGQHASVCPDPRPDYTVKRISSTILHRDSLMGRTRFGLGVGHGSAGSCVWGGNVSVRLRRMPLLVPAPGQRDVPRECTDESPAPDRDPKFYDQTRGYPVYLSVAGLFTDVGSARLELFEAEKPVTGDLFSFDEPYKAGFVQRMWCAFAADRALSPETWYAARYTAVADGRRVEIVWSFRTE